MSDSEHYRERAAYLRRLAGQAQNRDLRLSLLQVAADWWKLSEQAAKVEAQAAGPSRSDSRAGSACDTVASAERLGGAGPH